MSTTHSVKPYLVVFGALAVLTVVTVGISYLHLPRGLAIVLAVAVALLKAGLVGAYFMHLKGEKMLILGLVFVTLALMVMLVMLPIFDFHHLTPQLIHPAPQDQPAAAGQH